jgi:hypothetical protein
MHLRQSLRRLFEKLKRQRPSKRAAQPRRRLELEALEDRMLLSIALSPTNWTPIGPSPINNGQTPGNMAVSGRITGIAADPTDPSTIYVATAGGGMWKGTVGEHLAPGWDPLMDGNVNWGSSQPVGFMGCVTVDPMNSMILYAGTGQSDTFSNSFYGRGILKSTNGGKSWTLLTDNAPPSTDPTMPAPTNQFNQEAVVKIVVDRLNDQVVYAAVSGGSTNGVTGNNGIWKSVDGGNTWVNTTASQTAMDSPSSTVDAFTDLVIDPNAPQTLFAAVGTKGRSAFNGVYVTQNGGFTWHRAGNFPSDGNTGGISLAIAPSGQFTLYASVTATNGDLRGLFKSTDDFDGLSMQWTKLNNVPDYQSDKIGDYANVVAVDPNNANIVYAAGGGEHIIRSTDGGANWNDIHAGHDIIGIETNGPHADHHALAFDDGGKLLDGNDGGIWQLADPGGPEWVDLNGNLQITQFSGIALDPFDPNHVFGGSQDNGGEMFSGDSQGAWQHQQDGDMGLVRADPNQQGTFYAMQANGDSAGPFLKITKNFFGNWSYDTKTNGIPVNNNTWVDRSNFYTPFAVDPSTAGHLVLGTNHVYQTFDGGDHWSVIGTPGQNGWPGKDPVDSLTFAGPKTIFAAAGSFLAVTTDGGATWTASLLPRTGSVSDLIWSNQVLYITYGRFKGVNTDPTKGPVGLSLGDVWALAPGPKGLTWTDISYNLPDVPVNTIVQDPRDQSLLVGTDNGVFIMNAPFTQWVSFSGRLPGSRAGLPTARVTDLQLDTKNNILAAATYGRGVWEIEKFPALGASSAGLAATQGQPFQSAVVATFRDPTGLDPLGNYQATINWGDGSDSSSGTLQIDPNDPTLVDVLGSHTYAGLGSFTAHVLVSDADQSAGQVDLSVNVNPPGIFWPGQNSDVQPGALLQGSNADGRLEAFAIGSDGALWHRSQTAANGNWGPWQSLSGYVKQINVGRNADGRLEVFGIGSDNALWHIAQSSANGAFGGWQSLGG